MSLSHLPIQLQPAIGPSELRKIFSNPAVSIPPAQWDNKGFEDLFAVQPDSFFILEVAPKPCTENNFTFCSERAFGFEGFGLVAVQGLESGTCMVKGLGLLRIEALGLLRVCIYV